MGKWYQLVGGEYYLGSFNAVSGRNQKEVFQRRTCRVFSSRFLPQADGPGHRVGVVYQPGDRARV